MGHLSRQAVVDEAAALVDRDGWQHVTMTAVAAKLGVRTPSLYGHVENVEALLAAVQVQAHAVLGARIQRAAVGRSGEAAFRRCADAMWRFAAEHPGLYDLAMSQAIDAPAVTAAAEPSASTLAAVVESFGVAVTPELQMNCLAPLHGVIALRRSLMLGGGADTETIYAHAVEMVLLTLRERGAPRTRKH